MLLLTGFRVKTLKPMLIYNSYQLLNYDLTTYKFTGRLYQ